MRHVEEDVVGLPFAGRPAGVRQRRMLAVNPRRGAIGIGLVLVAIQDLNLILTHQENPAVAPTLTVAAGRSRLAEFQM